MPGSRLRAVAGIAAAQLRYDRTRAVVATVGVVLAVLSTTLLAGVGVGVVATGEERFDAADRDLWVTGGAVRLDPGSVGGFENTLYDSHALAAELESRDDVDNAIPMAFQTVYVSPDGEEFDTLVGAGTPASGPAVTVESGEDLPPDTHYANGSYDGAMTHAVLVGPRIAERYDVGVNDTLYVGGTLSAARANEFRIVGISPTFSGFLGTPTVTMHLSELQEITGSTRTDSATLLTVSVPEGSDPEAVAAELAAEYPDYEFRTNREQLASTVGQQAVLLASGASLVVLAALSGLALTVNLLLSLVYGQREQLAALRALGASTWSLAGVAVAQALLVGLVGGAVGVALTVPMAALLDRLAVALVGFEGLVRPTTRVLLGGFAVAFLTSIVGAAAAARRIAAISPLEQFE